MIDQQQQRAIAYLAARMRPTGSTPWDEPGIVASLAPLAHMQLAEVVMAVTRAASNPAAKTPGVIAVVTGEHWRERVTPRTAVRPPKRGEECEHHPGRFGDNCAGCAADRLAGDRPPPRPRSAAPETATEALTAARNAIRNAQGDPR